MAKKVLFTGGSGLLAINWAAAISEHFKVILGLHQRLIVIPGIQTEKIDTESTEAFLNTLIRIQPDIVIHCAGLTNIEKCEAEPELAYNVNVSMATHVALACKMQHVKLVFISTDHLFTGNQQFITEDEPVSPVNVYAQTKAIAEEKIFTIAKDALVIRTNFYGWGTGYRHSFSDFIISNLRNKIPISLFDDVYYTPILIEELAQMAMDLVSAGASGIYNIVGNERISKYEFGKRLAIHFGLETSLIHTDKFASRNNLVKRPSDLSLSNSKTVRLLNKNFMSLDDSIKKLYQQEESRVTVENKHQMIPYGRQDISQEDIQAVIAVLQSDWLTQGPLVPAFEKAVAAYCGAGYGVAANSATSALHIACLALGVGPGDIVWTSPITFVASANCAVYCGASVDFVDIDSRSYNMSVQALQNKLEKAKLEGKLPKVVIPVHLAGQSCEMEPIQRLGKEYGFRIIEDASHCIGGKYKDEPIGNCRYSDITVFSFHPVKIITTGEGGMAMTNDLSIAASMAHYRSHGIVRHEHEMTEPADGPWFYQQVYLGYNYRMTDIQAALGLSQLERLDMFVAKRHEIAKRYDEILSGSFLTLPQQHADTFSAYHLYIIRVKKNNPVIDHLSLFNKLRSAGVLINLHYIPVYRHPFYKKNGFANENFPEAESYYEEAISIPIFPGLTAGEQDFVAEMINQPAKTSHVNDLPKGYQNIF